MYKTDGLKHHQRVHGEDLFDGVTIPQNTTTNGSALKIDGALGAVEAVARLKTALALADTKTITVKLQHAGADLNYSDLGAIYTLTAAAGSGAIALGTELGRFALPSTVKANVRAVVITDDAAVTGTLDVIPVYLPR